MTGSNVKGDAKAGVVPYGPTLAAWHHIGSKLSLDTSHALSDALPTSLQVEALRNASGEVGFFNTGANIEDWRIQNANSKSGWWGIDVRPQTYQVSFYVSVNQARYSKKPIDFTISLRSNITGEIWANTTHRIDLIPSDEFLHVTLNLTNTVTAPTSNNTFAITFNAAQVAGSTFYFSLISLFPETFKGRKNGLRKDIGQALYDMKPKFLRFPGGNNLEGISVQTRWKWWKTIGPLKDRPGRIGNWNY
jgi:alpha-N-arabinofuranosidase